MRQPDPSTVQVVSPRVARFGRCVRSRAGGESPTGKGSGEKESETKDPGGGNDEGESETEEDIVWRKSVYLGETWSGPSRGRTAGAGQREK